MIENLGNKLKAARINKNLSRKQVSELIGVSSSIIGLYETNERLPSLLILIKLATIYKVSTDYLLDIDALPQNTLSVDGLTEQQIRVLQLTIDCFRDSGN